jgi:hypothetical protein
MSVISLATFTDSGTVVVDSAIAMDGVGSLRYDTAQAYREYTTATVTARPYFGRYYFRPGQIPAGTQAHLAVLNTGGTVVFRIVMTSTGTIRLVDTAGSFVGDPSPVVDPDYLHLIEFKVSVPVSGNGTLALKVDGSVVVPDTSASVTTTAINRWRLGRPVNSEVLDSWHTIDLKINDDQGADPDNTYPASHVPTGAATDLVNPEGNRRPVIPVGISQVNNSHLRAANDRFAVRFVPDSSIALQRFIMGFNLEGVYTDSTNAAAPTEIRTQTLNKQTVNAGYAATPAGLPGGWTVGTGRIGYAHGNGGTIRARLVSANSDGTPNMSNVLATDSANAVDRYIASKTYFGYTAGGPMPFLYFDFAGASLTADQLYFVVIDNTHADPLNNSFSVNSPTTALSAGGPHRVNTLSKFTDGAMAGLDPRESVWWSINSGTNWSQGEKVGGDTIASGQAIDRPGGHLFGYYSGLEVTTDEAVRLPWYGYEAGLTVPGYRDVVVNSDLPGAIAAATPGTRLLLNYNYTSASSLVINTPDLIIQSYNGTRRTIDAKLWVQEGADRLQMRYLNLVADSTVTPSPIVTGAEDVLFEYCDVTNNHTGIGFNIGNATGTYGPKVARMIIRYCRIHGIGKLPRNNHEHGIYVEYADNWQVYGNVIYDCADRGVQLYPDADNGLVESNIIYDTSTSIVISGSDEYGAKQSENNSITHNVLSNTTDQHLIESFWDNVSAGTGNTVTDNILWASARDDEENGGILTADGGFTQSGNTVANPVFEDAAAGNFTPLSNEVYPNDLNPNTPFKPFGQAASTAAGTILPVTNVGTWESGAAFTDTDINVQKPTGTVAGDVIIATIRLGANKTVNTPSGWTKIGQTFQASGTTPHVLAVYALRYVAGGPWSFTWDGTAQKISARTERYRNVASSFLVDASAFATGSSASPTGTAITTLANNSTVVLITANSTGTTPDPQKPTGYLKYDMFMDIDVFDAIKAVAGSTGAIVSNYSPATSTPWTTALLSMRPAAPASVPTQPIVASPPVVRRDGIQPYYNYLSTSTNGTLLCRKAGRAVTFTEAGGFAPSGQNVGVVTVTNLTTGISASTASLGSGLVKGALASNVAVAAGEAFKITASGTVYRCEADVPLVLVWGLGNADWPFTTEGQGSDRLEVFAL